MPVAVGLQPTVVPHQDEPRRVATPDKSARRSKAIGVFRISHPSHSSHLSHVQINFEL